MWQKPKEQQEPRLFCLSLNSSKIAVDYTRDRIAELVAKHTSLHLSQCIRPYIFISVINLSLAWTYSSSDAGLGVSSCWTFWDSSLPISPPCWGPPEWQHTHLVHQSLPSPPSFISSASFLRVHSVPFARSLTKMQIVLAPVSMPGVQHWPPAGLCTAYHNAICLIVQLVFHPLHCTYLTYTLSACLWGCYKRQCQKPP